MKLRQAAALALVGWYLMIPPKPGVYLLPGVFHFSRTFDNKKACDKAAAEYNQKVVDPEQKAKCVNERSN